MNKRFCSFTIIVLTGIILFGSPRLYAQDSYLLEINGGYLYGIDKTSDGDKIKSKIFSLGAELNFKQVELGKGPYEEASFVQKIGSFQGSVSKGTRLNGDLDELSINSELTYIFSLIPIFTNINYNRKSNDGKVNNTKFDDVLNDFGAEVGYYIMETSLLAVFFKYGKGQLEFKDVIKTDLKKKEYGIYYKTVLKINTSMYISVLSSFAIISEEIEDDWSPASGMPDEKRDTSNKEFSIDATLYLTKALGLGGGFAYNTGDDGFTEGNTYSAMVKRYFTPKVAIYAKYKYFDPKDWDNGDKESEYRFGVTGRF